MAVSLNQATVRAALTAQREFSPALQAFRARQNSRVPPSLAWPAISLAMSEAAWVAAATRKGNQPMNTATIKHQLATHGYIAVLWHIDDVKHVRPDLSDAQCMAVLLDCSRQHDAEIGITWDVLSDQADDMFPPAEDDS